MGVSVDLNPACMAGPVWTSQAVSMLPTYRSGQGIVMLEPDGAASRIVVGGSNTAWGQVRADRGWVGKLLQ